MSFTPKTKGRKAEKRKCHTRLTLGGPFQVRKRTEAGPDQKSGAKNQSKE